MEICEMKNFVDVNLKTDKIIVKIKEEATLAEIIHELKNKLSNYKKTLLEAEVIVISTEKIFALEEKKEIIKTLKKYFDKDIKFENNRSLGLHGIKNAFKREIATSETKFHSGSIRSGQKIEFNGSLVILGDVNSGAEVLAGENIVVLGILRGMVHAGANGNKEAFVAAASIESAQIRISNIIKEIERNDMDDEIKTSAYINEDDEIVIE